MTIENVALKHESMLNFGKDTAYDPQKNSESQQVYLQKSELGSSIESNLAESANNINSSNPLRETAHERLSRKRSKASKTIIRLIYLLVTSIPFNVFIMITIILNAVLMAVYST